uniref:hypothetical protein n=1 Tax=uncultured Dialister sp. TaxID=278064 RepID=UPI00266FCF7A
GERWYAVPKGEDRDLRFEEVETSRQFDSQTVRLQISDFGPILRASPSSFLQVAILHRIAKSSDIGP